MCRFDDVGIARFQHSGARREGPGVDRNLSGAVADKMHVPFNTTLGVNAELPLVALVGEDLHSLLCGADRVHDQLKCKFRLRCRVVRVVREVVFLGVPELAVGAVASVEQNCPAVAVPAQKKRKLSSAILRRLGREEGGGRGEGRGGLRFPPQLAPADVADKQDRVVGRRGNWMA